MAPSAPTGAAHLRYQSSVASWRPCSHPVHLVDTFAVLGVPPPSLLAATPIVSAAYSAKHHDHHGAPSEAQGDAASVFAAPWSPPMSAIGAVERVPSREAPPRGALRRTQSASSVKKWLLQDEQHWEDVEQQSLGGYLDEVYDSEQEEAHRPRSDPGEGVATHDEAASVFVRGNSTTAATTTTSLLTVDTLIFFVTCTVLGFGHSVIGTFLFLRLDEMGAAPLLMGLVLAANSFSETPVFVFVGTWLTRIGTEGVLTLALAALSVRYLAYEALAASRLWVVLPIECLHAITYAGGWSACAIHSARVAPPGLEVTTQAIFQGLWLGLGGGVAGLVGGYVYAARGAVFLFRCSLAVVAGYTVCFLLVFAAAKHR